MYWLPLMWVAPPLCNFLTSPQVSRIPAFIFAFFTSRHALLLYLVNDVFASLVAVSSLATAAASDEFKTSTGLVLDTGRPVDIIGGRLLRPAETVDVPEETEERGALSSMKEFLSKIKNYAKTTYWVRSGKSDDYVMDALKLKGLPEKVMMENPNYAVYKLYLRKLEYKDLTEKLKNEVQPHTLWEDLKLTKVDPDQLQSTDAYKTYVRYATLFENGVYGGKLKPEIIIDETEAEIFTKVTLWAGWDRPSAYVKEILGLTGLSKAQLQDAHGYKYYLKFLEETRRVE